MAEKSHSAVAKSSSTGAQPAMKRSPGHRAVDARDAIAELTERAQEISREAGTKVSIAMKDVISAAAGIAGFAVESARDLVQFMVRRGQMTTDEAEKLIREAEAAHAKRPASERKRPTASEVATKARAAQRAQAAAAREAAAFQPPRAPATRPAAANKTAKPAKKAASKSRAKKPAAKKSAAKKSAKSRKRR
jgi:polyhydroxyalkanoate synthesis regulator phasin